MIIKSLVNFGNSKGLIIPKLFLKLLGEPDQFSIEIENNKIILTPINQCNKENKSA